MTTTHTPGPWTYTNIFGVCRFDKRGQLVDTVAHTTTGEGRTLEQNEANGRLMAAAPELLAVLKDLVSMYERGYVAGVSTRTGAAFLDSILSARAAITKAETV